MIWGTDIDFFSPTRGQEKDGKFLFCVSSEFKKFAQWVRPFSLLPNDKKRTGKLNQHF